MATLRHFSESLFSGDAVQSLGLLQAAQETKVLVEVEEEERSGITGVYLLFREGECVYIGQSIDAAARIQHHIKETLKLFDSYAILPCQDRSVIEGVMVQLLQPEYNSPISSAYLRPFTLVEAVAILDLLGEDVIRQLAAIKVDADSSYNTQRRLAVEGAL